MNLDYEDEDKYVHCTVKEFRHDIAKSWLQGCIAGAVCGIILGASAVTLYISTSVNTISYP